MKIDVDTVGMQLCLQHACAWEAWVEGPIPLGDTRRLIVHVDCIILPSREAAEDCVWEHVVSLCEDSGYPFDPDDWDIISMRLNNGN